MTSLLSKLIWLAGIMQAGVVIGSLAVPVLLNWKSELTKVHVIIKQVFWTYAAYILCTNLFFAIVSIFLHSELLAGTKLATSLCFFITLYWGARLGIQFFYFDKEGLPASGIYLFGEWALVLCFLFFTIVYGWATYMNGWGMA